ncbi:phosphoenolpyruvate--protein phosphotransferase [Chitinispirillales bacterium ANBcel5]|uniref:phosphoenolpyruvate--protein phosphotransferase n=1 Tax=Cellulosispirillum alkaliphilum TaxID=3039283 RepID=UPI002A4E4312|nr:phosphoenolpyruvate--protein phosphotransferase [Chitinispirillales bacterium ANBcel5]
MILKDPIVNKRFKGISINSGRSVGLACIYSPERYRSVAKYSLSTDKAVEEELRRFEEVVEICSHELNRIARNVAKNIGKAEAEIFLTQKHILNDPQILNAIRENVTKERKNVQWAVHEVFGSYEEKFAGFDEQYFRERSTDIGEIKRRVLNRLGDKKSGFICIGHKECTNGKNKIIVAEELTAGMLVNMNMEKVLGIVTERGGITSHAAIIARSLGIPAVSGISGLLDYVQCNDKILINGDDSEIYLNPDEDIENSLIRVEQVETGALCILNTPKGMQVFANASTLGDVQHAKKVKADGIGLLRTEMLFIKHNRIISEDEQYHFYHEIVNLMAGKPVTFRLLDAGGDKQLPFMKLKQEDNPFLGWRGSRFLLGNPDILSTQLKALARVGQHTKIKIMFPMVVDSFQMKQLLDITKEILSSCNSSVENIEFGAMFETPSSFLQASEILKLIDFASIGSNDLIQYLFAIDRGNELVNNEYDPEHPVIWDLLRNIALEAKKQNKPLSICGEMAGRENIPSKLISAGITILSVTPRLIPKVRNELAKHSGIITLD